MATYYVRTDGNDANTGTGPGAGQAWKTIGKALGASGIASGDTVYIAPGVYREVVSVTMTSPTVETRILGDPLAEQFSDVEPGPVIWTAWLTNEKTAPSTSTLLDLNARDFLTFERINFIGGSNIVGVISGVTRASTNITLRRCAALGIGFSGVQQLIRAHNAAGAAFNWLIDRCILALASGQQLVFRIANSSNASDYDAAWTVRNSVLWGTGAHSAVEADGINFGSGTGKGGGGVVENCLCLNGGVRAANSSGNGLSTSIPMRVRNCAIYVPSTSAALNAATAGQIVEDYNLIAAVTPRTNVSAGANSKLGSSNAFLFHLGQEVVTSDQRLRLLGEPWVAHSIISAMLGFGSDPAVSLDHDLIGRPRPAGGKSTLKAVGALERHDTAARATDVIGTGDHIVIEGPGDHDIPVMVAAQSTTLSIKARYDTAHGTTNKPQVVLLANPELGVTEQTLTMTSGADTTETLTFSAFTPTKKGRVIVRCVSRASAGNGKAFFADLTPSGS